MVSSRPPPHRIKDAYFDGTGAYCGVCRVRVKKGLSGKGLRHVISYSHSTDPFRGLG